MNASKLAIASEHHLLLPGAADLAFDILQTVADELDAAAVPGLTWRIESVAWGTWAALRGHRHDYLLVTFGPRFPEHLVLIGTTHAGTALEVSLYEAASERLSRRVRRALLFPRDPEQRDEIGSELPPRDVARLGARIATVRYCLEQAVRSVTGGDGVPFDAQAELDDFPDRESED